MAMPSQTPLPLLSLRAAIATILLVVILPTLGVVAITMLQAGRSFRDVSDQRLLETARILAQSTASELDATERVLAGLLAGNRRQPGEPPSGLMRGSGFESEMLRVPQGVDPAGLVGNPVLAALISEALETGRPAVSNILDPAEPSGEHALLIAVPGTSRQGEETMVATLRGHPRQLVRSLERQGGGGQAVVLAVTDGTGRVVARSVDRERSVGRPVPDWGRLTALGTESGTFRAETLEGREIVFAFQRIDGTPGWMAVAGEPVASFDARWQEPIRAMILASVATIVLGLGLGLVFSTRILAPIRKLVERAERIARGETVGPDSIEDIGMIAEFETLRQSIAEADRVLQARLEESRIAHDVAQHSLAGLQQAERLARLGSWSLDLASRHYQISAVLRDMLGRKPDDPSPTSAEVAAHFPEADVPRFQAGLRRCASTGEPFGFEAFMKPPGREGFAAWIRGQAIRSADDRIIGIAGSIQDVSERAEQDARLTALADNLPRGAILRLERDSEGGLGVGYVSGGITRLTGITPESILADPSLLFGAIHEEERPAALDVLRNAAEPGSVLDQEFRLAAPDGGSIWVRLRAALRLLPDGRAIWDGVLLDISSERNALEALHSAKSAAEDAERAKSDFLATMSHEIRTPMNSVIGLTRLVLKTPLEPKQRQYLESINHSATVLLGIINDILDFSRIEAGGMQLERAEFKLEAVLDTVSSINALKAEEKGLEFTFAIEPAAPGLLRGDALRLGQVLTNLVGNAVKFTARGDISLGIRRLADPAPGRHLLEFSVSDSGIGLNDEQIAGLFRPFNQADSDTARLYGGTGLGLAICKRLVELMGGRIWVESQPGRGSTFRFTAVFEEAGSEAGAQAERAQVIRSSLAGRRVLIVDDNDLARSALEEMVAGFAMAVVSASSGLQGLKLLREADLSETPFELVLVDWRMPEMDGLAFARQIRADNRLRHLPAVLMVTAYGHQLAMSEADDLSLQGVVLKPVTSSVMFNTIQEALSGPSDAPQGLHAPDLGNLEVFRRDLEGRHVLIVDDNALNREVATEFLGLVGVTVQLAVNGREALETLALSAFDAVLMDVQMPVMNGLQAVAAIRKEAKWQDLPIIALTAQARSEDEASSLAAGMSGHLTKPIDEILLYRKLIELIGDRPPVRPAFEPEMALLPAGGSAAPSTPGEDETLTRLLRRFGGSEERLGRFVTGFLRDFGDMPSEYIVLEQVGDLARIADFVHRIKGVVGYIEATALFDLTDEIETAARLKDRDTVLRLSQPLLAEMRSCLQTMQSIHAVLTRSAVGKASLVP